MRRATLIAIAPLAVVCWAYASQSAAQAPPAVVVEVTEVTAAGGGTTYSYQVRHTLQDQSVLSLDIGVGPDPKAPWRLRAVPVNWTLDGGLQPGSVTVPDGWTATFTPEEEAGGSLRWQRGDTGVEILAAKPSAWFRVKTGRPDPNYSAPEGYFKVRFGPPEFRAITGRLTRAPGRRPR